MTTNVKPLRGKDLTPRMLLENVLNQSDEFAAMAVIGIRKDGTYEHWATQMTCADWCVHSFQVQRIANAALSGELMNE